MERAPLFAEVAEGPEGGEAWWVGAEDGVRLRIGVWSRPEAQGTVLLFPGRTEYVEKYGRAATGLDRRGYAMLTLDWRGQGLADRLLADRAAGHVARFTDYQRDVRAAVMAARALALPRPWHLLGHSMGGSIGLRALAEGMDVASAVFSAPMWGIVLAPWQRPFARAVAGAARPMGFGHRYAPGSTRAESYVIAAPFEGNMLTRDAEMYDYMRRQILAHPELGLGGPSLAWVHEALRETRALRAMAPPALPALSAVGSSERIVETRAIEQVMRRWPGGAFEVFDGAEHEILMDCPALRDRFLDSAVRLFERARDGGHRIAAAQ
jgi:lysophospholipase